MVKYCDLAICDSVNIEKYIHECYDGKGIKGSSPKTTFIAYGADLTLSKLADDDEKLVSWYKEKALIFKKSNVEDLQEKLQDACDHPEMVMRMKNQAADFICEKYNWDEVVKETMKLYRRK